METNYPTPVPEEKSGFKLIAGYVLLAASFVFYLTTEQFFRNTSSDDFFPAFVVHYFLAIVFTVVVWYNGQLGMVRSWRRNNIHINVILLQLYLISAYALNRSLPVFENSIPWLCTYLIIASLTMLSYAYYDLLPEWINKCQHLLLGSAIVLYFYLAVFVAEIYPIGFFGTIVLGVGAHIFVPVALMVGCFCLLYYSGRGHVAAWYWAGSGVALVVMCVTAFAWTWNHRVQQIEKIANQSVLHPNVELPVWVNVAAVVPNDWITQRILKSEMVYTTPSKTRGWDFMPRRANWDEARKHDPLVFLSSLISTCSLPDEERVQILRAISDSRHQSNERLWSGSNLTTSYLITDVDVYPALRIAYMEKYLNVRNEKVPDRWGNTQEAIYTFQLPEGSVVTSLSLWINGKEEKAILTSKQKATEAYNTIVGVERRDPSVIHWQEGNTVTVRVFPCTPDEERKFKIGITSPLAVHDGQLVLKNMVFHGPDASDAEETYRVRFIGAAEEIVIPADFKKDKKGDYIAERKYDADFELRFKVEPIKPNQFHFDGYRYAVAPYQPEYQVAAIKKIYLDINNSWSDNDVTVMKSLMDGYALYAFADDEMIRITNDNLALLTEELRQRNFSLFPFHQIRDKEHSIVVTKGKELSPHLSDFKESKFAQAVSGFFAHGHKVKVYQLEGRVSTYVASLRELRGLEFAKGSAEQLKGLLQNRKFPVVAESNERVVLYDAGLVITKQHDEENKTMIDNAPDHLARLFAYNDIMRKVGTHYFENELVNEELVDEAVTAYVVSPVSSLIVLETKNDYERFGIEDKDNSLKNASKQSSGAVPEPHEWALIVLFLLLVLYTVVQRNKLQGIHE